MRADRAQVLLRRPREAADEVAELDALDALHDAAAHQHADRRQPLPQPRVTQPLGTDDDMAFAHLLSTAIDLLGPGHAPLQSREIGLHRRHEAVVDVLMQVGVVVLDRQDVVAATGDNLGGDLLLAAHRVDGHQGTGEVEQLQEPRDRSDLVGLVVHGHLAEADVVGAGPGADQVQRRQPAAAAPAAAHRLAIDGDDATGPHTRLGQGRDPSGEASLERLRVQQAEDAAEGVVRGDAVGQTEMAGQPVAFGVAVRLHGGPGLGPGDDGTEGDADDIEEFMESRAFAARVDQVGEMMLQGDRRYRRHRTLRDYRSCDPRRYDTVPERLPASGYAASRR